MRKPAQSKQYECAAAAQPAVALKKQQSQQNQTYCHPPIRKRHVRRLQMRQRAGQRSGEKYRDRGDTLPEVITRNAHGRDKQQVIQADNRMAKARQQAFHQRCGCCATHRVMRCGRLRQHKQCGDKAGASGMHGGPS
jgi:endonuclease/exonuclease/phosphatase (EEP) superfamily protein YafD